MDKFSARKALPSLIIFAVLLNFSLFASQAVIDVANGFASVFADQAGQRCDTSPQAGAPSGSDPCANVGIAGSVLQLAGIGSVWSSTDIGEFMKAPAKHAPVFIGLALFVTITAVVLLAATIMLLIRAVILMFLMITSPIGFAGMAIPPLQNMAKEWWHQLINQAFFAPIFILLILISLKVVDGLVGDNGGNSLAAALINGPEANFSKAPQMIMLFGIVIGFMVASLMIAKKMGAHGANFATQTAGKAIGGATLGTVGFVGRRTAGRALGAAGSGLRGTRLGKTELGRFGAGILDRGAKSSFDLRATKTFSGAAGGVAGATGVKLEFGKPGDAAGKGYRGIVDKAEKERVEYAKSLLGRKKTKEEEAEEEASAKNVEEKRAAVAPLEGDRDAAATKRQNLEQKALEKKQAAANTRAERNGIPDPTLEAEAARADAELKMSEAELANADAALADANKQLAAAKKSQADTIARIEAATNAKGAKLEYSRHLAKKGEGHKILGGHGVSAGARASRNAAEKVAKEAGKSDVMKAIEAAAKDAESDGKKKEPPTPSPDDH